MKEIKQTKCKRCLDWFSSHIVVIAVIAFAIGLFLSSCNMANAETPNTEHIADVIPGNLQSIIEDYISFYGQSSNENITSFWNYYNQVVNAGFTDVLIMQRDNNNLTYCGVVIYFMYGIHGKYSSSATGNAFPSYEFVSNYSTNVSINYSVWCFGIGYNGLCVSNQNMRMNYSVNALSCNDFLFPNTSLGTTSLNYVKIGTAGSVNSNNYITQFNYNIVSFENATSICSNCDYVICTSSNNAYHFDDYSDIYPSAVIDNRLKFSTWSDSIGRSILHVDMTDYLNSTGFNISNTTLNEFTLSIEYTIKNSDDIETHNVSYNNSSEFYKEYGENGRLTKIYMNIPYNEFYGYSYESNSFPDYDDIIIQNAIINLDLVPVGGSTSINITSYVDCMYYLQHVYEEIVPDVIPDPVYEDTIIYDTTIINDMKTSLHNKSSQYSFISGDWVFIDENDLPTFENWASVFTNYVWFADANSDTTYAGHWWQMANNIPSAADFSRPFVPSEWVELNKAFAFYDVIVLKVWRVNVSFVANVPVLQSYDLAGYLVLYSDRYYQHYEVENQLGIIEILQNDATNAVSFYDAIKTRVDDFETKTLSAITGEDNSLFAYINKLDTDINSSISRIIDNMPVFNWTPFNDDDILMALYTIINNQENPKDGYARYIAWVKSESSAENGFKVWADDMFDVFHDVYNFFNYQDDINPNETGLQKYVDYVKLYIQYLTQQTDGISSNEYVYYKGIFDNTYDLHDVNG